MDGQDPQKSAEARHRMQLVLWAAMTSFIPVYFLLAQVVQPQVSQEYSTIITILLVLAIGQVAASFFIKSLLRARTDQGDKSGGEQTAFIVALVLCESAALFGIVVWFVAGYPQYYLFMLIGLTGMLLHYPKRQQ
jgi:F0F1-type ATP synthase membrane subunit c/vacuolar-type H+-ATPase subunit K